MKIIHSFLPLKGFIGKKDVYLMTLSMLLAKKHYEKVVLYTNVEIAKIIREIGLPYDEIDDVLLEGVTTGTFSIPKLIVYSVQTEPFIHIDLDTFLFKKINFDKKNGIYSAYDEGINTDFRMNNRGIGFFTTYVNNSFKLIDKLPELFMNEISFSTIPNMCVFGGFDYKLIADATLYCLKIYEENSIFFDSEFYNACIIEQLFIPSAIRMINKNNSKIKEITYLFSKLPNSVIQNKDNPMNYPFSVTSIDDTIEINNDDELYKNILYNFNGFLHLCGYKNFDKLIFLLRSKIMLQFDDGIKFLNKINDIFIYDKYDFEKNEDFYSTIKIDHHINLKNKKLI